MAEAHTFRVATDHFNYLGRFESPAFQLLGSGLVFGGLFEALQPFGAQLGGVTSNTGTAPSDTWVSVWLLESRAKYRWHLDHVDVEANGLDRGDQLGSLLRAITAVETWLREAGTTFTSHSYVYRVHGHLTGISVDEYLAGFRTPIVEALGEGRRGGVLFRGGEGGVTGRMMTVETSLSVGGGLFLSFGSEVAADVLPHEEFVVREVQRYDAALEEIGIRYVGRDER